MKRILVILALLLVALPAHARVVWESPKGFMLETRGWLDKEMFPMWTGVRCGLTIPHNGYFAILGEGALELKINGKWVRDIGITITEGCPATATRGGDTRSGTVNMIESNGCEKEGGRIIMLVRIPKIFPTPSAKPTAARWVERKVQYNVQKFR
jgi:hypothetical protein